MKVRILGIFLLYLSLLVVVLVWEDSNKKKFIVHFPKDKQIDTIPFFYKNNFNSIYFKTYISAGDKNYSILFDTGADFTSINSKIGAIKTGNFNITSDVYGKEYTEEEVEIDTLKIGKIGFYNGDYFGSFPFENSNGVLSGDLFRHFVWKFDFAAKQAYVAKKIENFDVSDSQEIPFEYDGNKPIIEAFFNGTPLSFLVDFGNAQDIVINTKFKDSLNVNMDSSVSWSGFPQSHGPFAIETDTALGSYQNVMGEIAVGGHVLKDEIVTFRPFGFNILGLDYFKRFETVILDYPNRKIYLGRPQYKSLFHMDQLYSEINTMGIKILPEEVPIIVSLTNDAEKLGLSFKDTVVSLNGEKIYGRQADFYKAEPEYQKITYFNEGIEKDTMVQIATTSKLNRLFHDFYWRKDTADIAVKRGGLLQNVQLVRKYRSGIPDTIQDFHWPLKYKIIYSRAYTLGDTLGSVPRDRVIFITGKPND